MYFIKIKGVNKLPDFVQVRDDDFTLVAYFRADRPQLSGFPGLISQDEAIAVISELTYGQLKKI